MNMENTTYIAVLNALKNKNKNDISEEILQEIGIIVKDDVEILISILKYLERNGFITSNNPSILADMRPIVIRMYLDSLYITRKGRNFLGASLNSLAKT
jgi:hypothetical protein